MVSQIEDAMYGVTYRGYNVCRRIERVQCMEAQMECTMYGY